MMGDSLQDPSDEASVSELLRLATTSPDDNLLSRYARFLSGRLMADEALSQDEARWAEINLEVNPLWQERWHVIGKQRQPNLLRAMVRRGLITASVLSLISLLWVETVHYVGLSDKPQIEALLSHSKSALRSPSSESRSYEYDVVVEGAWNLQPTVSLPDFDDVVGRLEDRYRSTVDPFKKGELAYQIAGLHEVAGYLADAAVWYKHSNESNSAEWSQVSQESLRRLQRRGLINYQTE